MPRCDLLSQDPAAKYQAFVFAPVVLRFERDTYSASFLHTKKDPISQIDSHHA